MYGKLSRVTTARLFHPLSRLDPVPAIRDLLVSQYLTPVFDVTPFLMEVETAAFDLTGVSDTVLEAEENELIYVYDLGFVVDQAVSIRFKSASENLSGLMPFAANDGLIHHVPYPQWFWCTKKFGDDLMYASNVAAAKCAGWIGYFKVKGLKE